MYYLKKKDGDSVYSVDRFTFDFYFLPEGGLYDLLKTSLVRPGLFHVQHLAP